jgi:hypothetical protein
MRCQLLSLLAGCAQSEVRLFTKEQEAELKAKCEQGCVVVPTPIGQNL